MEISVRNQDNNQNEHHNTFYTFQRDIASTQTIMQFSDCSYAF